MLVECEDCGREVSDRAGRCPHCGCPIPTQRAVATGPASAPAAEFVSTPAHGDFDDEEDSSDHGMWIFIGAMVIALLVLIGYFATAGDDDAKQQASAEATEFAGYTLTGTANVRDRPSTSSEVVAQAKQGGFVEGDMVESGGQKWLRLSDGEFEGRYIWSGNLKGSVGIGEGVTFGPAPPKKVSLDRYIVGKWREESGVLMTMTTCDFPEWSFDRGGRFANYDEGGMWDTDAGRLILDWAPTAMNDYESSSGVYTVQIVGPDEMIMSSARSSDVRYIRC